MSEATDQMALFEWAERLSGRVPELVLLLHIPNGEKRDKATAARLKAMGVRAGIPDILLPIPNEHYHGLWIELKTTRGTVKPEQLEWHRQLREQGYMVCVCRSWCIAACVIAGYLDIQLDLVGMEEYRDAVT